MRRRREEPADRCPAELIAYDERRWPSRDAWFDARCAWLDEHGLPSDALGPVPDEPFDPADI